MPTSARGCPDTNRREKREEKREKRKGVGVADN